jgi:hypothetical protein
VEDNTYLPNCTRFMAIKVTRKTVTMTLKVLRKTFITAYPFDESPYIFKHLISSRKWPQGFSTLLL